MATENVKINIILLKGKGHAKKKSVYCFVLWKKFQSFVYTLQIYRCKYLSKIIKFKHNAEFFSCDEATVIIPVLYIPCSFCYELLV